MFKKIIKCGAAVLIVGCGMSVQPWQVNCAKWNYAKNGEEKFRLKHTLDMFPEKCVNVIRQWDAARWLEELQEVMNGQEDGFLKYPPDAKYEEEKRMSIILLKYDQFLKTYQNPANQKLACLFDRNPNLKPVSYSDKQEANITFYPEKVDIMMAIFDQKGKYYHVYKVKCHFALIGSNNSTPRVPIHLEAIMRAEADEDNAHEMIKKPRDELQRRFAVAEKFNTLVTNLPQILILVFE